MYASLKYFFIDQVTFKYIIDYSKKTWVVTLYAKLCRIQARIGNGYFFKING